MDSTRDSVTVEMYVRPAQLSEPITDAIDSVRRLEAAGRIDSLSVQTWPSELTLSERTPYSAAIDAFERMAAWADEHEFSIRPPFSVRTTTSTITDDTRTTLRTPGLCLAVSVGSQLATVFPHSRGDERYSVSDGIEALRSDTLEAFPFAPRSTGPPPDRCAACDRPLITVQGIGVCQDCDRIELGTVPGHEHGQHARFAHRI